MNLIAIVLIISTKIYMYRFNVQDNQYLQSRVQAKPFTYFYRQLIKYGRRVLIF